MPNTKETTQTATTYPTVEQYDRWKSRANEMDMSMSEFIQAMTEAGLKKFERDRPDEAFQEVRRQRDEYYRQRQEAEARVRQLEKQLQRTERGDIEDYIQNNPGADVQEIIQHLLNDVPSRVADYLDDLETAGTIKQENDQYYFNAES